MARSCCGVVRSTFVNDEEGKILKIFPKLNDGSHMDDPKLHQVRAKKILIEQSPIGAKMPAAFADGELVGSEPLNVEVAPGALRVLGARVK